MTRLMSCSTSITVTPLSRISGSSRKACGLPMFSPLRARRGAGAWVGWPGPGRSPAVFFTNGQRSGLSGALSSSPMNRSSSMAFSWIALSSRRIPAGGGRPERDPQKSGCPPKHHIFQGGHVPEERQVLEGTGDPQPGNRMGFEAVESLSRELKSSVGRRKDPCKHVEQRRLPGSVRADKGFNLALGYGETQGVHRSQAPEGFPDPEL